MLRVPQEANVVTRSFRSLSPAASLLGVLAMTLRVDAQAGQAKQITIVQEMAPMGVAFGQTLRYTWANTTEPDAETRVFEPLRVAARLLAGDGSVLAQAAAEAVGPGGFQSFDFSRAGIGASGDLNTGRLQLRIEATVVGRTKYRDIVLKPGTSRLFHHAVEVIDDVTGHSSVSMGGSGLNELSVDDTPGKESGKGDTFQIISAGRDGLIGVTPDQRLRLSASNPLHADADRRFKVLFAHQVLDAAGTVIAQDEVTLEPGQSHAFDVPYAQLATAGAEITGRVQVRTEMRRHFVGIVSRISTGEQESPASLELVDAGTGRTVMLRSSKPKEIVVVGSKCCQ